MVEAFRKMKTPAAGPRACRLSLAGGRSARFPRSLRTAIFFKKRASGDPGSRPALPKGIPHAFQEVGGPPPAPSRVRGGGGPSRVTHPVTVFSHLVQSFSREGGKRPGRARGAGASRRGPGSNSA